MTVPQRDHVCFPSHGPSADSWGGLPAARGAHLPSGLVKHVPRAAPQTAAPCPPGAERGSTGTGPFDSGTLSGGLLSTGSRVCGPAGDSNVLTRVGDTLSVPRAGTAMGTALDCPQAERRFRAAGVPAGPSLCVVRPLPPAVAPAPAGARPHSGMAQRTHQGVRAPLRLRCPVCVLRPFPGDGEADRAGAWRARDAAVAARRVGSQPGESWVALDRLACRCPAGHPSAPTHLPMR